MLIGAYGMFWSADDVDWSKGINGKAWQLLGRHKANKPALRVADFRFAQGVYVLFDHHRAYYVGLAVGNENDGRLGARLKAHLSDEHAGLWQRFCWFAFDTVSRDHYFEDSGLTPVERRANLMPAGTGDLIREVEALLIKILGTSNIQQMKFADADEWLQVPNYEADYWLAKVKQ